MPVDADDRPLAAVDLTLRAVGGRRDFALRPAELDRAHDAAHVVDRPDETFGLGLHAVGQRLDVVAAAEWIGDRGQA